MSDVRAESEDEPEEHEARRIVEGAATRALGARPGMREVFAVVWSAVLGASLSLPALLLMPEDWLEAPVGFERLALSFIALWLLALVPALSQALLSRTPPSTDGSRRDAP